MLLLSRFSASTWWHCHPAKEKPVQDTCGIVSSSLLPLFWKCLFFQSFIEHLKQAGIQNVTLRVSILDIFFLVSSQSQSPNTLKCHSKAPWNRYNQGPGARYPTLSTDTGKQGAPQSVVEQQPRRRLHGKVFPTRAKNWLKIWQTHAFER